MTILDEIVKHKRMEITQQKGICSMKTLQSQLSDLPCYSLKESLLNKQRNGIIAEFKRQSPSKGLINGSAEVAKVVFDYQKAGVSAVSVLTDSRYFGGSLSDLKAAAQVLDIPILRKDFVIDPYQILEARVHGASVVLLIASILSEQEILEFTQYAHQLQLEVLFEIHSLDELQKGCEEIDVYGVNNRNLKTFQVDIEQSIHLYQQLPAHKLAVAESGIHAISTMTRLQDIGFNGFLIGENFMKTTEPGAACIAFSEAFKNQQKR